ncbi:MAG: hypothetical protein JWO13_1446 [Acidobacteriales bacterium]|nr:hypothetical protein [Terriglobales bacterium]
MKKSAGIRLRNISFAVLAFAALLPSSLQCQTSGAAVVTGRIPEQFQIQLAEPVSVDPRISVEVTPVGTNAVLVRMKVPKSVRQSKMILPLAMRTNSATFALRARSKDASAHTLIAAGRARAMGDGALLISGAAEAFTPQTGQMEAASVIASGTRISRRGNGLTPNNGLIADLQVSIDANDGNGEFSFVVSMERL